MGGTLPAPLEVRSTKPTYFSSREICIPPRNSPHDQRRFGREEPDMWKVYKRLSQMEPMQRVSHCEFAPRPISIPGDEGMRCMCYEKLLRIIRDRAQIPPPQTFRCPNGRGVQSQIDGIFPNWIRKAVDGFHDNEERQLPLATLVARWQQQRRLPNYDCTSLRRLFSRYGSVAEVRALGTNSSLIIFNELRAACDAMQDRYIGEPTNRLHCSWWHKSMSNKFVVARNRGISVQTNLFIV